MPVENERNGSACWTRSGVWTYAYRAVSLATGLRCRRWQLPEPEPRTFGRDINAVPRFTGQAIKPSVWFELARRVVCSLAGVEERLGATGPEFRIGPKLLGRLDEDGVSLLVFVGADEREVLTEAEPRTFSSVVERRGHPTMCIHLAYVDEGSLRRILEQSWRERAPKRLVRSASRP